MEIVQQVGFGSMRKSHIKGRDVFLVYFAVVSFGIADPFYNFLGLLKKESSFTLLDVAFYIILFQGLLPVMLYLIRRLFRGRAHVLDHIVLIVCGIAIIRNIQLTYFSEFVELDILAKASILVVVSTVAVAGVLFFRAGIMRFCVFPGYLAPILAVGLVYGLVTGKPAVPLSRADTVAFNQGTSSDAAPLIVVIMDELSMPVLLGDDGTIDPDRFPNLRRFASESVWFRQAITNYDLTNLSFPSLLSGRYIAESNTPEKFVENIENLPNDNILRFLRDRNYQVQFHTGWFKCEGKLFQCPNYWNAGFYAFNKRIFFRFLRFYLPDFIVLKLFPQMEGFEKNFEAESMLKLAGKIAPGSAIIFHTLFTHAPFVFSADGQYTRSEYGYFGTGQPTEKVLERYLDQITYFDSYLGRFFAALRRNGWYDKAVIALISDHGTCWEDGCQGRSQTVASPTLTRVPVMIRVPGVAPRIDEGDFQLIDLAPTLLEALGFGEKALGTATGRASLHRTGPKRPRLFHHRNLDKSIAIGVDVGLPAERRRIPQ